MKQLSFRALTVFLTLFLMLPLLLCACDVLDKVPKSTESELFQADLSWTYRLNFTPCEDDPASSVASIVVNPYWEVDFAVTIPETDPEGRRVVGLHNEFSHGVPMVVRAETFETKIMAPIQKRLAHLRETSTDYRAFAFYYEKFKSYFNEINVAICKTEAERNALLEAYPFADRHPFYAFATDVSSEDICWVLEYLYTYTDYELADRMSDIRSLTEVVEQFDLNETQRSNAEALLWYNPATYMTSLELPNGLRTIDDLSDAVALNALVIPDSVESIGSLERCSSLVELILPYGVRTVDSLADCRALQLLSLPSSLTAWQQDICAGGTQSTVVYRGTIEQWNAIYLTSENDRIDWTVVCSDGEWNCSPQAD